MAIKTLICGLSGTGKSTSARNLENVAVVNPVNKPLPFKNHFTMLNGETDSTKIVAFMKEAAKTHKVIIVDDFQYLLSIPYMRRIKETGWDKYNDFASNYYEIIEVCDKLPDDVTVYFMTHTETLEDGTETVKLIGKLLREKICIEGLFTTVLKTLVNDGKYYFITQNSGRDNVKSPMGMFDTYAIDNDLAYVDAKIRSYYEVGDNFLTDEEMAEIDEINKRTELEPPKPRSERKSRARKPETKENGFKESETKENEAVNTTDGTKKQITLKVERDESGELKVEPKRDENGKILIENVEEKPARKSRKAREQVQAENTAAVVNANANDEREEIPLDEAKMPELEPVPKRRRRRAE